MQVFTCLRCCWYSGNTVWNVGCENEIMNMEIGCENENMYMNIGCENDDICEFLHV